jgi:hypothetical protein
MYPTTQLLKRAASSVLQWLRGVAPGTRILALERLPHANTLPCPDSATALFQQPYEDTVRHIYHTLSNLAAPMRSQTGIRVFWKLSRPRGDFGQTAVPRLYVACLRRLAKLKEWREAGVSGGS